MNFLLKAKSRVGTAPASRTKYDPYDLGVSIGDQIARGENGEPYKRRKEE